MHEIEIFDDNTLSERFNLLNSKLTDSLLTDEPIWRLATWE